MANNSLFVSPFFQLLIVQNEKKKSRKIISHRPADQIPGNISPDGFFSEWAMPYKPVEHISFNQKKHPRLLWIANEIGKATNKEAATVVRRLVEQAGTEEIESLGTGSGFSC